MNKHQEAINELYKQRAERYKVYQKHKDWSKEIKEYDKVGEALETLQELVDKETPKKVKAKIMSDYAKCHYVQSYEIYVCPVCGLHLSPTQNYCDRCSQKLDWSDEDV